MVLNWWWLCFGVECAVVCVRMVVCFRLGRRVGLQSKESTLRYVGLKVYTNFDAVDEYQKRVKNKQAIKRHSNTKNRKNSTQQ